MGINKKKFLKIKFQTLAAVLNVSKKTTIFRNLFLLCTGPGSYKIDGPTNWVKFDKDMSSDACLKNMIKIFTYGFFLWWGIGHYLKITNNKSHLI